MKTAYTYWAFEQTKLEQALKQWAATLGTQNQADIATSLVLDFLRSPAALEKGIRKEVSGKETTP